MATMNNASGKRGGGKWLWPLAGVLVVLLAVGLYAFAQSGDGGVEARPIVQVQRGPLTISVAEAGTLRASEQVILKSEVEGQTTIISLVDEGTMVEAGDLLIELDASPLEDQKLDQQIRVQNAEAAYIRARENLEVVRSQGQSDVAEATLAYQFAQEDLTRYIDGEYPQKLKEAESRITLANEELERAEEKLKWSQRLYDEKYISQTELEADRLSSNRARLDYDLAVTARDLLVEYTHKRQVTEYEANIEQTRMALDRVQRKARADVIQAEADLKAKEAEFKQQQDRLTKIETQITKTRIISPTSGMVVYATSAQGSWRGNAEPLDEGQQVRERQELIYLPTAQNMIAEVKVHESAMDKVQLGMPAMITVDALPGRSFTGKVTRIAPLPDQVSAWLNPDLKVYSTEIRLDGDQTGLRTGMSCRAEILIERYPDALYVPIQSVVRVDGQATVFVPRGRDAEQRAVEIGLDNNRMVHILAGLDAGERVLAAPPLASASTTGSSEADGQDDAAEDESAISRDNGAERAPAAQPRSPREGGGAGDRAARPRPSQQGGGA